jgi:predicted nucleic acid-binding protein
MTTNDTAARRSILFSARVRYSPQGQPIRETAIDKIMEQNLLIVDSDAGLTLTEIQKQGAACFAGGAPSLSKSDMQASLRRLLQSGRVERLKLPEEPAYRLTEGARNELWAAQEQAEVRFTGVVKRLLKDSAEDFRTYLAPFLECLCIIFADLGEKYVEVINGDRRHNEMLTQGCLRSAVQQVAKKHSAAKAEILRSITSAFFREADPSFDAIKWNLAQNYYIAKALGLDPGGLMFSKEVFGGSSLFLDTNVIIPGLDPTAPHHKSFKALSQACKKLDIELNVCRISIDELSRVVEYQRSLIAKVANQIPDATAPRVRGGFYRLYREHAARKQPVDIDEVFAAFLAPTKVLIDDYKVALIDDVWFTAAEKLNETVRVATQIRQEYQRKRGRPKSSGPALHDALMLRWIERERGKTNPKTWFITLDTSLPQLRTTKDANGDSKPVAITLDAFMQWISSIALLDDVNEDMAAIFAEAMRYQLLPQENLFDLRDFLVFAEMDWSCRELPAEDVEGCIHYLKAQVPNLDPTSPADREKLAHQISKFFTDPGRKFKQALEDAEAKIAESTERTEAQAAELRAQISALESSLHAAQDSAKELQSREKQNQLQKSALARLWILLPVFLAVELVIGYAANRFGTGSTLGEKLWNSKEWLGGGILVTITSSWWILGKDRIRALGWPFTRIFGEEPQ